MSKLLQQMYEYYEKGLPDDIIPTREDLVKEFHVAFGHPTRPEDLSMDLIALRKRLVIEEWLEVIEALDEWVVFYCNGTEDEKKEHKVALLKELCDLQYVLSGLAVSLGLDLERAFERVHRSNMSKLGDDGKPLFRADGKVLKSKNYKPPVLEDLV